MLKISKYICNIVKKHIESYVERVFVVKQILLRLIKYRKIVARFLFIYIVSFIGPRRMNSSEYNFHLMNNK